jgi:2-hydroxychromene-2-carboxylate isomerase
MPALTPARRLAYPALAERSFLQCERFMGKQVDFYFDVGSPASYLAWTRLPGICRQAGAALNYKPMLLGGVYQATGNTSPAAIPVKGRYVQMDLERHARRYGVALVQNPHFPINTLFLMRLVTGVQLHQAERLQQLLAAVFDAMWVRGSNLHDAAITARTLSQAGFDPEQALQLTQQPQVKDALKAVTAEAVSRGVFGAPTTFVGEQMFFGQDRLDFVREALS